MSVTELTIHEYLQQKKQTIDALLVEKIDSLQVEETLLNAMRYSLRAGGKRIRPILLLATLEAFEKKEKIGYEIACALEMVHTYSLIHDDLPAMDNDDLRRGKPTNHKIFGEAHAILAGDALLTYSFQLIAQTNDPNIPSDMKVELIRLFAKSAGAEGMVGGQALDLEAENNEDLTVNELEMIHNYKTGKLLAFAVLAGALLSGASEKQYSHLEQFAFHIGIAFQIRDDILDIEGDEKQTGKSVGSDFEKQKSTYPKLLSLDGAKKRLVHHADQAKEHLYKANINHNRLEEIVMFIIERNH